jgi:hypothetical protein
MTAIENLIAAAKTDARRETLRLAHEAGADVDTLAKLADAVRVARADTITIPTRYGHLSRGKSWARQGQGAGATWGERDYNGSLTVGTGRWLVYSSDGFKREERVNWLVEHVAVGDQTWTIAN